jgi:glycosyltransferase involved in cell wall biosynthesis
MSNQPLVTIGLPTYNRGYSLRDALESALTQDYQNIELVISDNGSTDETQAICLEACARDKRIRYFRFDSNQGPTVNFSEVLKQARGEFFMWFSDDDWMDRSYVSEGLRVMLAHADVGLVCGREKYYDDGKFAFESLHMNLLQDSAPERVQAYFRQVTMNGTIYGMMRRELLTKIPFHEVLAGDWLVVAQMAFLAKVKTLESAAINRSVAGESQDIHRLAASGGLSKFWVRNPHLKISFTVFKDIVWGSPVYRVLSLPRRLVLGSKCFVAVCRKYCVPDWHQRLYVWAKRVEAGVKHRFAPLNKLIR